MELNFTPNNNEASKMLFTGRTNDLEDIFKLICSGNCILLYGERKSGKTLTLEMIKEIINGDILNYQKDLIDQTFNNSIPKWQNQFTDYKAIYVSFHGIRTEEELFNKFVTETEKVQILPSSNHLNKNRLSILLDELQKTLSTNKQKGVVLLDEMEILEAFEDGTQDAIAELFCDRTRYSEIIFIHAGSYQWKENVHSPGSLFTHVEPHYLKSINESDMEKFLLKSLSNNAKSLVIEMSGCKPLYAQYMGKMYETGIPLSEEELLNNDSIYLQIEQNIYHEKRLDNESKNILAALAYHPGSTENWIATKLKLNKIITRNKLTNLERFGTLSNSNGKYKIVGKFIEKCGKELCNDPCRNNHSDPPKSLKERIKPLSKGIAIVLVLILALLLYSYIHPPNDLKEINFSNGTINLDIPHSLEANERGTLSISVSNYEDIPITSLKLLFNSEDIQYVKNGKNSLSFSNIEPHETNHEIINYYVRSHNDTLMTEIIILEDAQSTYFKINYRQFPLKQYEYLLYGVLLILIIPLIPRKWLDPITTISKKLFTL